MLEVFQTLPASISPLALFESSVILAAMAAPYPLPRRHVAVANPDKARRRQLRAQDRRLRQWSDMHAEQHERLHYREPQSKPGMPRR